MKYSKVYIVTSDDFGYAGEVCRILRQRGVNATLISIASKKSSLKKKFVLALSFGLNLIAYLYRSAINKFSLSDNTICMNSLFELSEFYKKTTDDDLFLMVNVDSIIKDSCMLNSTRFLNFHPSLLPYYKGLGPIFWCYFDFLKYRNTVFGWSIHRVTAGVDEGGIIASSLVDVNEKFSLGRVYDIIYLDSEFINSICRIMAGELCSIYDKFYISSDRFLCKAPKIFDSINLIFYGKSNYYLILKYLINGGLVGLVSWILQAFSFAILKSYLTDVRLSFSVSVYISFLISLVINYLLQEKFVFRTQGVKTLFVAASFMAITFVNLIGLYLISIFPSECCDLIAYPLSALILMPFVFLFKKYFVFSK